MLAVQSVGHSDKLVYNTRTVRENIDAKIKRAEEDVLILKATRAKMEKTGLLDIPIHEIREAMNF